MLRSRASAAALLAAATVVWDAADAAEFVARTTTITEMKAVFGQVESRNVIPSRARIGGTVREIRVSEGSEVKEGDVVAVVVDDKIALELQAADSKINALKSQLENARTELERAQQLLARGVTAQSRLDMARMTLDVVLHQVAAAQAEKSVIEQRAREGDVVAPATGRVLTVPVTPGSVVLPGEDVARIATGAYYLRLSLPERHAAEIVEGGTVIVGTRGLAQPLTKPGAAAHGGRIAKVYPEISKGRVTADVEVAEIGDYFVNERMLVSIPVGKRSVLAVPPKAVKVLHGVDYVRVATPDGEMDIAVILGERFEDGGDQRIEVLTGLRDGDRIVLP